MSIGENTSLEILSASIDGGSGNDDDLFVPGGGATGAFDPFEPANAKKLRNWEDIATA